MAVMEFVIKATDYRCVLHLVSFNISPGGPGFRGWIYEDAEKPDAPATKKYSFNKH